MTPTILALLLAAGLPVPPQASQLPPWYHWLFEAFRPAGGGSGTILTVTGVSPLALVNALAAPIHSLTQYGKCEQSGTPTPDSPVDIMTNNGRLVFGKPLTLDPTRISAYINESGYWIYSSDSYSVVVPVEVGSKVAIRFTNTDSSVVGLIFRYGFRDNVIPDASTSAASTPISQMYRGTPQAREYVELTADRPYLIIQLSNSRAQTVLSAGYLVVSEQEVYPDGTPEVLTVCGKNLYNKADGVVNGYPSATGTWNSRSGDTSELSIIVTLEEGKTYTAQRASGGNCPFRVMGSANRPLEQGQRLMVISSPTTITNDVTTFTVPSGYPHIVFYVRNNAGTSLTTNDVVNAFQVELGSAPTAYEPYVTPQTITNIPMLLSVGDYKDEAELIQGIKTGKVGVVVFDGTETWTRVNYNNLIYYINDVTGINADAEKQLLCTHFGVSTRGTPAVGCVCVRSGRNGFLFTPLDQTIDTVVKFNAFLAGEYAAGTPVIVVYPLATEQTEQTTPHELNTVNGTTIVSVTSPVDPVELRAEYKGVVT